MHADRRYIQSFCGRLVYHQPYGSNDRYTLKVSGIIRQISESIVISEDYAEKLGLNYTVNSIYTDTEKADIASGEAIKSVQSKQRIMDLFDTFIELMNTMIFILILGAVILGVVVLYNLGMMVTRKNKKIDMVKALKSAE